MLPKKHLVHVCQIILQTTLIESGFAKSLQNFLTEQGFDFKMMTDLEDEKILRFSIPLETATVDNVSKIHAGIKKLDKDAKFSWPGLGVVNPDLSHPIPRPQKFDLKQSARCNFIEPLPGNDIAPALIKGKIYPVLGIVLDKATNQHLDMGLKSDINFVRSYETEEWLDRGADGKAHLCHPSRFTLVKRRKQKKK